MTKTFYLIALLCLPLAVFAQTEEIAPFKLTLTPEIASGCVGKNVEFNAVLENISDGPVAFDPKMIGYSGSVLMVSNTPLISRTIRGRQRGYGRVSIGAKSWTGHMGPGYEPEFLTLQPGEKYEDSVTHKIEKEYENMDVKLSVRYGQFSRELFKGSAVWRGTVRSNEISLRAQACGVRSRR